MVEIHHHIHPPIFVVHEPKRQQIIQHEMVYITGNVTDEMDEQTLSVLPIKLQSAEQQMDKPM
jgi:hypothetical protein